MLYSLPDIAEKNNITVIENAIYIATDTIPTERIKAFMDMFDVKTVTLVTTSSRADGVYEVQALCNEYGVEFQLKYQEKYTLEFISAYCIDDLCTVFLIENENNTFCFYRSQNDTYYHDDLLTSDILLIDSKVTKDGKNVYYVDKNPYFTYLLT